MKIGGRNRTLTNSEKSKFIIFENSVQKLFFLQLIQMTHHNAQYDQKSSSITISLVHYTWIYDPKPYRWTHPYTSRISWQNLKVANYFRRNHLFHHTFFQVWNWVIFSHSTPVSTPRNELQCHRQPWDRYWSEIRFSAGFRNGFRGPYEARNGSASAWA